MMEIRKQIEKFYKWNVESTLKTIDEKVEMMNKAYK
jgi:hypothetical protein